MYLVKKHVNKGELTCIFKYKVNLFFHNASNTKNIHTVYLPPPQRAFIVLTPRAPPHCCLLPTVSAIKGGDCTSLLFKTPPPPLRISSDPPLGVYECPRLYM